MHIVHFLQTESETFCKPAENEIFISFVSKIYIFVSNNYTISEVQRQFRYYILLKAILQIRL